jgi:hypothetical protein
MNTPQNPEIVEPADDVYGWVEQSSSVMFKAVTRHGDPVELTAAEARAVAEALLELAARLESLG